MGEIKIPDTFDSFHARMSLLCIVDRERKRREFSARVRTIAKRLVL